MKKRFFLIATLALLVFFSGCNLIKVEGDNVDACFYRACTGEESLNGWSVFLESGNKIRNFNTKDECINEVYKLFKVDEKLYSSLDPRIFGLDYRYVKGLTEEEVDTVMNLTQSNRNNPYTGYQKVVYDTLAEKYPKLSFLKIPCACSEFCLSTKSSNLNIKASTNDLISFLCGGKYDLDLGYYIVHNDCCWVKSFNCDINPNSEKCSYFKCGDIGKSEIPPCGCLCGTEILARDTNRCCKKDTPVNC
jgi:hypothetical protein